MISEFKRACRRIARQWRGETPRPEDLSVIPLGGHAARRVKDDAWEVCRVVVHSAPLWHFASAACAPPPPVRVEVRVSASDLTLPAALDLLAALEPAAMRRGQDRFDHPAAVARAIGHALPAPPLASCPKSR